MDSAGLVAVDSPLAAAHAQLDRLWHVSNLYRTEPAEELAVALSERFGGAQAFFCNSGAEAVEAVLKYARKATGKPVVAYPNSGERWDASARAWTGPVTFRSEDVKEWISTGARLVGGCCRVGPTAIRAIRDAIASLIGERPKFVWMMMPVPFQATMLLCTSALLLLEI